MNDMIDGLMLDIRLAGRHATGARLVGTASGGAR